MARLTPAAPWPDKKSARKAVRAAREEWSGSGERPTAAAGLAHHGLALAETLGVRTVTLYAAWPTEPPTAPLTRALLDAGVRVLVPLTQPDLSLHWAPVEHCPDGDLVDLEELALGAELPPEGVAEAGLVLTPGLAVDRTGHRLGQGGGCYDRTLPHRSPGTPVVTMLHPHELVEEVPHEAHDQPVDGVLTADGVRWFDGRAGGSP